MCAYVYSACANNTCFIQLASRRERMQILQKYPLKWFIAWLGNPEMSKYIDLRTLRRGVSELCI